LLPLDMDEGRHALRVAADMVSIPGRWYWPSEPAAAGRRTLATACSA
jgi:hypothetical protein